MAKFANKRPSGTRREVEENLLESASITESGRANEVEDAKFRAT